MSSWRAACDLPIPELLRILNEKLSLECTRLRETRLPPVASAASLESEVSKSSRQRDGTISVNPQIQSLETRVHDILKLIPSLRNLLQPVNRLPPEVLSRVAQHTHDKNARDTRSIIPLTHVCQHWREAINSAPEIWTLISTRNKGLTGPTLERCKATPLEIELNLRVSDHVFFDLLLPRIRNVRSLTVHGFYSTEELARVLQKFPWSTPSLRTLVLRAERLRPAEPNPSTDPFETLANTLEYLLLDHIPLYPSFLRLTSLTELVLVDRRCNYHLNTILAFLKENHSLEAVGLGITFAEPSLRNSQLCAAIGNRLLSLSIYSIDPMDSKALISSIALQKGATLYIDNINAGVTLRDIISGVSMAHLSNLSSPILMECRSYAGSIRLAGPNGTFSFYGRGGFPELSLLPLTLRAHVRELRLVHRRSKFDLKLLAFPSLSFPALETLAVDCSGFGISQLFSALFSDPSSSPSLKTLGFLDFNFGNDFMGEDFMEELTKFAFDRKSISARLHRVVFVDSNGKRPYVSSVNALRKYVPVIDVLVGKGFPTDLTLGVLPYLSTS